MAIFSFQYLSIHTGDLAVIDAIITHLYHQARHTCLPSFTIVFTDFCFAIQALQAPGQQNAQSVIQSIIYQAYYIENSYLKPFKI